MKNTLLVLTIFTALLSIGCKTIHQDGPEIAPKSVKPKLQTQKNQLKSKVSNVSKIPEVLGGIVQSDSWIIYKDKQQEEFKGNVFFDNGIYTFKSDYALSERAKNRFSASGNIYLKQVAQDGNIYEAYASKANYNYALEKGALQGSSRKDAKIIYTASSNLQKITATAKKIDIDMQNKIFVLDGNVKVVRESAQGIQTITAQKATLKQIEEYLILEGNATLADEQRTLEANTIIYDGFNNISHAYGNRPLLRGTMEQGTFAIIADEVISDSEGQKIKLDGKVQGWLVSPKINDSAINTKF